MPPRSKPPESDVAKPGLRVDIDAVALWEPMGEVREGKSPRKVAGLSVQSWDFRPPKDAERGATVYEIVISENPEDYKLEDGTLVVLGSEQQWTVEARYIETREFPAADGSPRPKHFFEVKVPKELKARLRESPEDILAKSDLYDGTPPKSTRGG